MEVINIPFFIFLVDATSTAQLKLEFAGNFTLKS
jgi:hypothetical protein